MLTRTHISRREQAAVHKSMRAELHRHASTSSASYERDIAQLEQQLREHHATEPNPAGPKPMWHAQLVFARSVTLPPHKPPQATTGFATPMPSTAATHNRKACRRLAKTLSTTAKDAELARTFLDDCGAAQGADGRYLWPLLALHPAARARPSPEELKRWLGKSSKPNWPAAAPATATYNRCAHA